MKKIHHYSKDKFLSFTPDKQQRAVLDMLAALESNINDPAYTTPLLIHLKEVVSWMPKGNHPFDILGDMLQEDYSPQQLLLLIAPLLNAYDINPRDDDIVVARYDGNRQVQQSPQTHPLVLVLDNLRSAYNVGAILRTAECFGFHTVYLCGITPTPDNPKVQKTAMEVLEHIEWEYVSSTGLALERLHKDGYHLLALETTDQAKPLMDVKVQQSTAVVMGNEALGIDIDTLKQVDEIARIPLCGWKNSLNVGAAFAIAAYALSCANTKK